MQNVFSKVKFYKEENKLAPDTRVPLMQVIRSMAEAFHDDPMNKLLEELGGPITYLMCDGKIVVVNLRAQDVGVVGWRLQGLPGLLADSQVQARFRIWCL